MCNGSEEKACSAELATEGFVHSSSDLLELSATDDISAFINAVEKEGRPVDEFSVWYGRRIGSKEMGFEERTPLMIASMLGSKQVVKYILEKGGVDVNRACGSDGATALHCAVAGGSAVLEEIVKLLIDASADVNALDANGKRPFDLISQVRNSSFNSRRKMLEVMLNGGISVHGCPESDDGPTEQTEGPRVSSPVTVRDGTERKEYPVDPSLPDIKNGLYGTDEFRMYTFKVKPCSRAYSHDWTECPFVHPGENARRRDPRKYHYSCVPCPDFRRNTCQRGDACEYAHGIFECWLHPAQYRTRLCKDETNCTRRVCFFAHKVEELRPLYASTGSAVPSPRSFSSGLSSLDMASMSPLALGSPSIMMPPSSTPPMSPRGSSSPNGGSMWPNQSTFAPPTLQLPGSRLKSALNARDVDLDTEFVGRDARNQWRQQFVDDISWLPSPLSWNTGSGSGAAFAASSVDRSGDGARHPNLKPTNLDDIFVGLDSSVLTHQLQGLSLDAASSQLLSPTGSQMRQNMNQQLLSAYTSGLSSSPVRTSSPSFGNDPSGSASAFSNSRAAAFAKRSQSFIDRTPVSRHSGMSSPRASAAVMPAPFSDWSSPDGKLDWGIQKEEISKMRKSASFGFRSNGSSFASSSVSNSADLPWVHSLGKEVPPENLGPVDFDNEDHRQYLRNSGGSETLPSWIDQLYMEQEQILA
ncbi:OLC1v1006241C1 [Oldenlandia corymbosa var. corymbosa]|uniref:OLC1v1006241C1 n=1 Tax=Oldenlandia corymbosa var. corymbosa TaxID=529605 RepID=A0AAV1DGL3_OLDCO|nr:OLC1v1006241C1 [Oldenlandia corymbosa var. corymbosa]